MRLCSFTPCSHLIRVHSVRENSCGIPAIAREKATNINTRKKHLSIILEKQRMCERKEGKKENHETNDSNAQTSKQLWSRFVWKELFTLKYSWRSYFTIWRETHFNATQTVAFNRRLTDRWITFKLLQIVDLIKLKLFGMQLCWRVFIGTDAFNAFRFARWENTPSNSNRSRGTQMDDQLSSKKNTLFDNFKMDALSAHSLSILCVWAIEIERWLKLFCVALAWMVPFKLILIFRMAEQWRCAIEPAVMWLKCEKWAHRRVLSVCNDNNLSIFYAILLSTIVSLHCMRNDSRPARIYHSKIYNFEHNFIIRSQLAQPTPFWSSNATPNFLTVFDAWTSVRVDDTDDTDNKSHQ